MAEKERKDGRVPVDMDRIAEEAGFYRQQMQSLFQQAGSLDMEEAEIISAIATLENSGSRGDCLLVPVGSGVFVKSKRNAGEGVLVNIGAGLVVEKSAKEAVELLAKKQAENKRYKEMVQKSIQEAGKRLEKAERDLEMAAKSVG